MTGALPVALGAAWGVLVATPLVLRALRYGSSRVAGLRAANRATPPVAERRWWTPAARRLRRTLPGRVVGDVVDRRRRRAAEAALGRELPVTIDLLAVAVGAGCTPYGAIEVAARWAPADIAARLDSVPRACALGSGFADALERLADDAPPLRPLAEALTASDRLGAPIGPALNALAGEERAALRRRAETHARTVPVRLLFPLVFLVLPAFALLTVIPAVLSGLSRT